MSVMKKKTTIFYTYLAHVGRDEVRLLDRELPLECKPRLELLLL